MESKAWRLTANIVLGLAALLCLAPFVLLIMSSFSDEAEIARRGYSFWPQGFSTEAYDYLFRQWTTIGRGYLISAAVTVVGTAISVLITTMFAYPLSRPELPGRKIISLLVFFTMLFNGGLVASYLVWTQIFQIKNTAFALLIPGLLMNGYNIFMMRTFFTTSIPPAVIESARIDGAGEFRILFQVVMPLSLPILATIGLFAGIAYWNDWFNGLIYLTDPRLFSLQNILNRIIQDIQFLSQGLMGDRGAEAMNKIPNITVRMAIAVLGVLPILAAYPFFQKYFVKGIAVGAVKG